MENAIERFEIFRVYNIRYNKGLLEKNKSKIIELVFGDLNHFNSVPEIIGYIDSLLIEVDELTSEKFVELLQGKENKERIIMSKDILHDFKGKKEKVISELKTLKERLQEDPQLIKYANTRINKMLNIEFNGQIQPVKSEKDLVSEIVLTRDEIMCFYIELKDNKVANDKAFISSPFSKATLIDDVYILDDTPQRISGGIYYRNRRNFVGNDDFSDMISCLGHNEYLLSKLRNIKVSAFEDMINTIKAGKVIELINTIFPNQILSNEGKLVCSDGNLDIRNLATGSKMFAIIKMLLERGQFDEDSILILDEPESHLHPEWQNIFAEIVVLLVKEVGLRVLLTTHSPNFLLAIDTFSKKYDLVDKSHFYNSKKLEDNYFVNIECIDDRIDEAYASMSKPFLEMDSKRTALLGKVPWEE
jgi:ABC-type transport system involved in cytochrome c biogenesis ATPase subunit